MPGPEEILGHLARVASQWKILAIVWHAVLAVLVVALATGWRPGRRLFGSLVALLPVSVSVLAWQGENPFNGTVFAAGAASLIVLALRLPGEKIDLAAWWQLAVGGLMLAFGWLYPHFVQEGKPLSYLYAAPTGLIPCPSLSTAIGLGLIADNLGSRAWSLTLAALGLLYGFIGAFRLGVWIDLVLLAGAVFLGASALLVKRNGGGDG